MAGVEASSEGTIEGAASMMTVQFRETVQSRVRWRPRSVSWHGNLTKTDVPRADKPDF
jgi:hypothetical protein